VISLFLKELPLQTGSAPGGPGAPGAPGVEEAMDSPSVGAV
jgi:hypothetical protein